MVAPKLPTMLAGLMLIVGNLCVNAASAEEAKKGEAKGEPAATVVALTPTMSIQLLPGYTHQKKQGRDSVVGEIVKKDGLTIIYDIGKFGPGRASSHPVKNSAPKSSTVGTANARSRKSFC